MILSPLMIKKCSSIALSLSFTLLFSCQNTPGSSGENIKEQRATLADLAAEQTTRTLEQPTEITEQALLLSKKQRAAKLVSLYQAMLTTEPNKEVRAKIEYRLVQIGTQAFEEQDVSFTDIDKSSSKLALLVTSYQQLLTRFPNQKENEEIQYQLAKALSLQGKLDKSLLEIESFLTKYPDSRYSAELHFRRGDIYYNLQHYSKALAAYHHVLQAKNNQSYYVNSVYMSAWTLFKLNRLTEADSTFLQLLDYIVSQEKIQLHEGSFSFTTIDKRYVSLVDDIQRVLSISLSQQQQAKSLVALINANEKTGQGLQYLYLYRHVLFENLADFLLENDLKYAAEQTYLSYIALAPNSVWSARYSLALMSLYQQQGKYQAIRQLKVQYVQQYGLQSEFWQQGLQANYADIVNEALLMAEILPNLLKFSYQHSRYLYAQAQAESAVLKKRALFATTSNWLGTYLALAKLPQAQQLVTQLELSQGLLADELLYADASFEAHFYQQALNSYEYIAYQSVTNNTTAPIRKEAAYAATLTVRKMLALFLAQTKQAKNGANESLQQALLLSRERVDSAFIKHYSDDARALTLAVQQAQFAFNDEHNQKLKFYSDFILQTHGVLSNSKTNDHKLIAKNLNNKARKQVQIATQLQANNLYRQEIYPQAEHSYDLALNYVALNSELWLKMRELLAASIYFQGQSIVTTEPLLAVEHYLRLGKRIPESSYSLNAQFDAANLLFAQHQWQEAVNVLLAFQKRYPTHEYTRSIPAKLAQSYEQLQLWELAASQYLVIVSLNGDKASSNNLKREALYSAGELYLKAGNLDKAITTFRTYAHTYPEPFDIAQEVRFKMSKFYQQTNEPNKQYYWYRKMLKFHRQKYVKQVEVTNSRAIYLVSVAALGLGEAHQKTFSYTKLTLPLNKSLKRKQKAMKQAIAYYQKLLSYQLAEFVPHATYNLAQMYRQLASDVLSSQRPKNLDELALEEYELLIEDIAFPFEEKAIEIHMKNSQRSWQNIYDQWVAKSFTALAQLAPALYDRHYQQSKGKIQEGDINAVQTLH